MLQSLVQLSGCESRNAVVKVRSTGPSAHTTYTRHRKHPTLLTLILPAISSSLLEVSIHLSKCHQQDELKKNRHSNMKRNSCDIPSSPISSASDTDTKPDVQSTSHRSKRLQPTSEAPASNKKMKKEAISVGSGGGNGEWDSEKKAAMMDTIIAAGYRATDLDSLAVKVCHLPNFVVWLLS